jgi:hypothetical protein
MFARLLRRTECIDRVVPRPKPTTAGPNRCYNSMSFPAAPNQGSASTTKAACQKPCRKRVRVEGLYLERESEPILHARSLLKLIRDECPEKVGSFIPRRHLERAYRELCNHQGWHEHSWMALARALGKLTRRKLLKRNGVRFVAYRIPSAERPRMAARIAP